MTQAFNLSQFANKVNTSGQADLTTAVSGLLPVANGGTGTASPAIVAGTGITVSGSFPNQTINSSAGGAPAQGAIGDWTIAWGDISINYTLGSTIAGSSLKRATAGQTSGGLNTQMQSSGGGFSSYAAFLYAWPSMTAIGYTGTWTCRTNGGAALASNYQLHLWVRTA